jgi:hypothetical protein
VSSTKPKKNLLAALALGLLFPGLGHFYLGLWKRGILWVLSPFLGGFIVGFVASLAGVIDPLNNFLYVAVAVVIIACSVDVYLQTKKINSTPSVPAAPPQPTTIAGPNFLPPQ